MNDPEMPGRIIAQMAMAPAKKKTHHGFVTISSAESAASVSDRSPSSRNIVAPMPSMRATDTPSILSSMRNATQIEPRISPKNNADIRIGSSWRSVSITDESARIAVKMPASSVSSQIHSMRLNVSTNPATSRVSSCLSP